MRGHKSRTLRKAKGVAPAFPGLFTSGLNLRVVSSPWHDEASSKVEVGDPPDYTLSEVAKMSLMNPHYPPTMPAEIRLQMDALIRLLRDRGAPRSDHCPECEHTEWYVDLLGISAMPLKAEPYTERRFPFSTERIPPPPRPSGFPYLFTAPTPVGPYATSHIPVCSFVCTNCGYMKLYNLRVLGVTR